MEGKYLERMDCFKDDCLKIVSVFQKTHSGAYCDIRIEIGEGKGALGQMGNIKMSQQDYGFSLGARVLVFKNGLNGMGFCGKDLGLEKKIALQKEFSGLLETAFKRAKIGVGKKIQLVNANKNFGKTMKKSFFEKQRAFVDSFKARFAKNPFDMSLEELADRTELVSKQVQNIKGISSNAVSMGAGFFKKLFANSEGSLIEQTFPIAESLVFVIAKGKAIDSFYAFDGKYAGTEVFDGKGIFGKTIEEFADYIAKGTIENSNAPALKKEEEAAVILDPWYNTLISHEIMGHPSEADRALKKEGAWAGRSWWYNNEKDNLIGKKIASEELNVFSDPSLREGYGHYKYDDEGIKAKKIFNVKNGILNEFLNSRETALVLGKEPNGGMRANSADMVPLIRMNNTCIAPGKWKKEEIFKETKNGYYAVGDKIPSIGETRQNFTITSWKLYKIEKGEITKLYRNGGISADTPNFLKSIDAIGNDFKLFNVPNCGKGTPMQTMRVGNGGPTIRAKARVTGSFS